MPTCLLLYHLLRCTDHPYSPYTAASTQCNTHLTSIALQDPERQKECEELLGPIGDDKFTYLKDVGRLITDYSQPDDEPGVPGDALDDDIGVAVEFEGDEDADEDSEVDEVEVITFSYLVHHLPFGAWR